MAIGHLFRYCLNGCQGNESLSYPGFKKSAELFNLHRAIKTDNHKTVIVVEGFFDTMKVHQAGFPNVVGLMGSSLSVAQARLLATYFDSVVVMLDGDEAGKQGTQELITKLADTLWVRIVHLADCLQPDRLSSDQLRSILSPVIKSR